MQVSFVTWHYTIKKYGEKTEKNDEIFDKNLNKKISTNIYRQNSSVHFRKILWEHNKPGFTEKNLRKKLM